MSRADKLIDEYLEGEQTTMTPGMMNALTKVDSGVMIQCGKCGFKPPKYQGRYPKTCPMCGTEFEGINESS